ncbi:UDP-glycosyltransferase 76B1-like isoform X2 [Corylus avellana]|uniref:UDP-glycosyltransferase 76B1-like isoform X2 n=1 Tax=Corylus avellana TaxID=13451 RepID=UPI00286D415F|nr:UDP-glycosyltransferase 76B1-like isoform X2 [Corylus avellana]
MMEKEEAKRHGRRLVLVVCPFQGHINPMLQLATILYSKGFSITVLHPEFNSPNHSNHPNFSFVSIPGGLSNVSASPGDIGATISAINRSCEAPFQRCLEQILEAEDPHDRVAAVIYDGFMHFAQRVANHLKLTGISMRTIAAATLFAFAVSRHPDGHGYIPFLDSLSQLDQEPELEALKLKDIIESAARNPTFLELRAIMTETTKNASAIIVNTIHFLEQKILTKVQQKFGIPIFPVGPFHKLAPSSSSSLLEEDTNCISWLDKQALESVIYVSFGSMTSMDENELLEIALGLASSEQPFLWVVRPGSVRGSEWVEELLPEGFWKRVEEGKGCIVKWAPQKEVLAHGAVGGFWSHCGWNSTLESVWEGVPMLCRPIFGDQPLNVRYVCDVWKIGLEMEGVLERGKIEKGIRRLMIDSEGLEIRQRAKGLKEKANFCLSEDGSSYNALNELVQHILSS